MPGGYSTDYLRNLTVWRKTADQHKKIGGSISVRMDCDRVVSVQKGTVDFQTASERKKEKKRKKEKEGRGRRRKKIEGLIFKDFTGIFARLHLTQAQFSEIAAP